MTRIEIDPTVWPEHPLEALQSEAASDRGAAIMNHPAAEGRGVVAMLLAWRQDIPIEDAVALLPIASKRLSVPEAQAWMAAVSIPERRTTQ